MPLKRPEMAASSILGIRRAGFGDQLDAPFLLEDFARGGVRHVAVAGKFVREGTHVASALDVVLSAQWINTDAFAADVASEHGEVGDAHDHRRTLRVLGDAEAVIDSSVGRGGVSAGSGADLLGSDATSARHGFGRILILQDELAPSLKAFGVAALGDELFVFQAFVNDGVRERVDHGDVGAWL